MIVEALLPRALSPLKISTDRVLGMSLIALSWGRSSRPLLLFCS